jgi:type III secretory pathway component EscS
MTITILLPLLVAIVGLLVYALAASTKLQEAGRLAYACGLLVTLLEVAGHVIRF